MNEGEGTSARVQPKKIKSQDMQQRIQAARQRHPANSRPSQKPESMRQAHWPPSASKPASEADLSILEASKDVYLLSTSAKHTVNHHIEKLKSGSTAARLHQENHGINCVDDYKHILLLGSPGKQKPHVRSDKHKTETQNAMASSYLGSGNSIPAAHQGRQSC